MYKEQKANYIKGWLQRFGYRDNDEFYTSVVVGETTWHLSLQYNFDFDGNQIEPNDWCRKGFKDLHSQISNRSEEELDEIIYRLNRKKVRC